MFCLEHQQTIMTSSDPSGIFIIVSAIASLVFIIAFACYCILRHAAWICRCKVEKVWIVLPTLLVFMLPPIFNTWIGKVFVFMLQYFKKNLYSVWFYHPISMWSHLLIIHCLISLILKKFRSFLSLRSILSSLIPKVTVKMTINSWISCYVEFRLIVFQNNNL